MRLHNVTRETRSQVRLPNGAQRCVAAMVNLAREDSCGGSCTPCQGLACGLRSDFFGRWNDKHKPYREKKQATCVFQFASVHERCKGLGIGSKPSESWTGNNHGACVTAVQTLFESCGPLFTAAPAAASARIQARRCLSAAAAVRAPAVRGCARCCGSFLHAFL